MTVIQATIRSEQGTGASRRLRHDSKVPAVKPKPLQWITKKCSMLCKKNLSSRKF